MTKLELIFVFLFLSIAGASENPPIDIMKEDVETEESLFNLYERFLRRHSLNREPNEKMWRFQLFKKNALFIYQHNTWTDNNPKTGTSFKLALYKFADLTKEEFNSYYTGDME